MLFKEDVTNTSQSLTTALVTDNIDPEGKNRLKVQYTWDNDFNESYWARMITLISGDNYGTQFVPEIGDEVLVSFLNGDVETPIIMGSLWNEERMPPYNTSEENSMSAIKSKSGHELVFNDTQEDTSLKLQSAQEHKIILDDKNKKIIIEDNSGNHICIDSGANEIIINSSMNIKLTAGGNVDIKSDANITIEAAGVLTLSGSLVKIN